MSHKEQMAFFDVIARNNRSLVDGCSVLEIGSYDVNGSIRDIFSQARRYLGVDLVDGPGVDLIGFGHGLPDPDGSFDVVISGECFEHDSNWAATFENMVRLTRPGGITAFTCASRGRPEHGTRRTSRDESPGTQAVGIDYYRNLDEVDFAEFALDRWFSDYRFWTIDSHFDLFFAGIRAGGPATTATLPTAADVAPIRGLMSTPHRVVRIPLRVARRVIGNEDRFQDFAVPYWKAMRVLFGEEGLIRG